MCFRHHQISSKKRCADDQNNNVCSGFGDADGAPADVSIPTLYDIYLKPWAAYVAAGGRGAMASHNSVNGQPCHSSKWLLTDVFRNELVRVDALSYHLGSHVTTRHLCRGPCFGCEGLAPH